MLTHIPRLGLVAQPSPVTALLDLAREIGAASLHCKRDDLLTALYGGSKVRKLDYLLASEPYRSADGFVGIGATGSGLLVALAAAARTLGKPLHACCFDEHEDDHVRENFAFTSARADRLDRFPSRAHLALLRPALFTKSHYLGRAIVPPGATNAAGMVGIVAAALELKEQIDAGLLPLPQQVFVAYGSGGTVAGLRVGLALAGVRCELHAVTAIEKPFSTARALDRLTRELIAHLTRHGVSGTASLRPLDVRIDRSALGGGYGVPTKDSIGACHTLRGHGVHLEAIYSGKAMAALMSRARGHVLFWQTNRGAAPSL